MHMKEICYYLEEAKLLLSYCSKKQKSELDHFLKHYDPHSLSSIEKLLGQTVVFNLFYFILN